MIKPRVAVAALSLSAAGLVSIALHEGYSDQAVIPMPGDRPTIGFGSTTKPDGSAVRWGEKTTPSQALSRALADIEQFEGALKSCVKVPLHQHEYDAYLEHAYNVGAKAFCDSTMVKLLNASEYERACAQFDRWTYFQGKDCRNAENKCSGLVRRRASQRARCEGRA